MGLLVLASAKALAQEPATSLPDSVPAPLIDSVATLPADSVVSEPPPPEPGWEKTETVELQAQQRLFYTPGLYPGQYQYFTSVAVVPDFKFISPTRRHQVVGRLFARYDLRDQNRTHFDIREMYYKYDRKKWSLDVGIKKVFWGVTESNHLVDIINQADQVEDVRGEAKLGQPMLQFKRNTGIGGFELFYLPYARRRQFPAQAGRLRFPFVVNREDIPFDDGMNAWRPSFAFRWSHRPGSADLGASYFHGVAREPLFLGFDPARGLLLSYPIINQAGLDAQFTHNSLMLKLEAIYRHAQAQEFFAFTTGLEYTLGNVFGSGLDVGLVGEYTRDTRGLLTFSGLDNDVFAGARFAFNDTNSTEFLLGGIQDLRRGTLLASFRGSRRLGKSFKLAVEANVYERVSPEEILYNFRQDGFVQFSLSKYFSN
jgi:hypothetical protein